MLCYYCYYSSWYNTSPSNCQPQQPAAVSQAPSIKDENCAQRCLRLLICGYSACNRKHQANLLRPPPLIKLCRCQQVHMC
jgi:hypothetical protein